MIDILVTTVDNMKAVAKAAEGATFRNIGHAGATIRKDAIDSISVSDSPSAPGKPPHTRRRQLNRSIRFDYDKRTQTAVIGPMASIVGEAGAAHEHGGEFRGQDFDPRPFMGPALDRNLDRFASDWAGSIGE